MDLNNYGHAVVVKLSQKNLLDLMAQSLEGRDYPTLTRVTEMGPRVTVIVEPNDVHYEKRIAGPGSGLV